MPAGTCVSGGYLVEELLGEADVGDVVAVAVQHPDRHLQAADVVLDVGAGVQELAHEPHAHERHRDAVVEMLLDVEDVLGESRGVLEVVDDEVLEELAPHLQDLDLDAAVARVLDDLQPQHGRADDQAGDRHLEAQGELQYDRSTVALAVDWVSRDY